MSVVTKCQGFPDQSIVRQIVRVRPAPCSGPAIGLSAQSFRDEGGGDLGPRCFVLSSSATRPLVPRCMSFSLPMRVLFALFARLVVAPLEQELGGHGMRIVRPKVVDATVGKQQIEVAVTVSEFLVNLSLSFLAVFSNPVRRARSASCSFVSIRRPVLNAVGCKRANHNNKDNDTAAALVIRWPSRHSNPMLYLVPDTFRIISQSLGQATGNRDRPLQPEHFKGSHVWIVR